MQNIPTSPAVIREAWNGIASGFDRHTTPLAMSLGEDALGRAGFRSGMRFLDVASGTGGLSIPAARMGARVLATDISPAMVEHLEARAREEGLSNLEARVMDGSSLDLEDDAFDMTASQNGVSLFPDLQAGLREMVRVTKPGGSVVIIAFGPLKRAEWLGFFVGAVRAVVQDFAGLPTDPPPPPFQVADTAKLRREMVDAGLAGARVETLTWKMAFRDGPHLYDAATSSNPIGERLVSHLTDEQRDDVRRVLDGMLRERSGGGPGAVLECQMNVGIGTK